MSSITSTQMETTLQMYAWGRWAKPRYERMLGAKSPGWASLVTLNTGYYHAPDNPSEPITDEYAEKLDRMIARLPEGTVELLFCLYMMNMGVNKTCRYLQRSKHVVTNERDSALGMLYGALHLQEAG